MRKLAIALAFLGMLVLPLACGGGGGTTSGGGEGPTGGGTAILTGTVNVTGATVTVKDKVGQTLASEVVGTSFSLSIYVDQDVGVDVAISKAGYTTQQREATLRPGQTTDLGVITLT